MPRPKSKMPAYRYHLSGQAIVTLDGRDFYLGPHQSAASLARYAALIRVYQEHDLQMPEGITVESLDRSMHVNTGPLSLESQQQRLEPIKVRDVTAAYRSAIEMKYANSPQELHRHGQMCDLLEKHHGKDEAVSFGPVKLKSIRETLIESGKCRPYVNRLTQLIIGIFTNAVSEELIDVDVVQRLKTLPTLRRNQTTAPEPKRRTPVSIEDVRKTAVHVSPIVKAMLRIQLNTGMRPKELCGLRPCDIDRSGETWMYRPMQHKTAHHGIKKAIPISGDARLALTDYLNRKPDSYCFSPAEAMAWMRAQRRAARTTPESCGNRPGTNRAAQPKKQPGQKYDAASYRHAIQNAAKKAGVAKWTPYQIRHLTASEVREALGIEAVAALLGHAHTQMSEHYAIQKEEAAIKAARAAPKLDADTHED